MRPCCGRCDPERLALRARKERAVHALWWLLERVPEPERTPPVVALAAELGGPPRGYRPLALRFDPSRLLGREARWARRS